MFSKKKVDSYSMIHFSHMNTKDKKDNIRIQMLAWLNDMFKKIDDDNIETSLIELILYNMDKTDDKPMIPNWFDRLKKFGFYDKRNRGIRGASTSAF